MQDDVVMLCLQLVTCYSHAGCSRKELNLVLCHCALVAHFAIAEICYCTVLDYE